MPTPYPKCSPSEMVGLLVLLSDHKGAEDVARLAGDLDLEIDEILPALEFAELLGLVGVKDGRATLTEQGKKVLAATIRDRKAMLREHLKHTTLFKALVRALESSPERMLTEEEMVRLIDFTTAPADEFVQNIVNWGRFTELFRYDSDRRVLLPARPRPVSRTAGTARPPSSGGSMATQGAAPATRSSKSPGDSERFSSLSVAFA
ncbi:MAG: AAA-associated domain-containing protein [Thermoplasmata archaeon]|nr:AAA-associated domain-containing protein [Thermoplasmata archaeon]